MRIYRKTTHQQWPEKREVAVVGGTSALAFFVLGWVIFGTTCSHTTDGTFLLRLGAATTGVMSSSTTTTIPIIRGNLLTLPNIPAAFVWKQLVAEGAYQLQQQSSTAAQRRMVGVAMEVGMHRAVQCLQAATAGFQAHCIEPSPVSFRRVQDAVEANADPTVKNRIHLYQAAAGNTSNALVDFVGTGNTGDHVGEFDVWNMKAGKPEDEALAQKQGDLIQVPTIRLDDIIERKLKNGEDRAFIVKIDTQGYEPAVMSGLTRSLAQHKVYFVLMEYWPAGMDLIMNQKPGTCIAATLIQQLLNVGYTVYALPASAHPKAPLLAIQSLTAPDNPMPLYPITAHCQWFYSIAKQYPSDTYKMGYWADILAVAPGIQLPTSPITALGKVLLSEK